MRYLDLDFSTLFYMPFGFYDFSLINCSRLKDKSMMCKVQQWISPLRQGSSLSTKGWDNHGFLNDKGGSYRTYRNQGDGHGYGIQLMHLNFSHVLNVCVPTIFCIVQYIFLLNVANYAFTFSFSGINLRGIVPSSTQGVGKGKGKLTLCGPSGEMWTQVGKMMNGVMINEREVIYVDGGAGPHNQNRGFPCSTTLKPRGR